MATERDSKGIVRQWDREIEADDKRCAPPTDRGPWRGVAWTALWLLWLLLIGAVVSVLRLHG